MKRKKLKIFTKISFFTALVIIIAIPPFIYKEEISSDENVGYILNLYISLALLASVFGTPLSIVSMFSKENFAKRIFALIINLLPVSLFIYALGMEFIDEFLRTAP